jgi:myo-inositol-1(or 4)-monophosphatase
MRFLTCCSEIADSIEEAIGRGGCGAEAGETIGIGADGTPTARIDQVAEEIVIDYLMETDLCGTLISEERGELSFSDAPGTIFLDPIDGTHNLLAGIPFYAISIAYAEYGTVTRAFVRELAHGETFTAESGKGAFLNGDRIRVSDTAMLEKSTMSVYGRRFNPETVMALGQKIRRWRLLGASAVEICYVAAGRMDAFVDMRNTLRVTDAAAGMLICEEAGGTVSGMDGRDPGFPASVAAGRCLVASNSLLHKKILEYLAG